MSVASNFARSSLAFAEICLSATVAFSFAPASCIVAPVRPSVAGGAVRSITKASELVAVIVPSACTGPDSVSPTTVTFLKSIRGSAPGGVSLGLVKLVMAASRSPSSGRLPVRSTRTTRSSPPTAIGRGENGLSHARSITSSRALNAALAASGARASRPVNVTPPKSRRVMLSLQERFWPAQTLRAIASAMGWRRNQRAAAKSANRARTRPIMRRFEAISPFRASFSSVISCQNMHSFLWKDS